MHESNCITHTTKIKDFPNRPSFKDKHKNIETSQMYLLCGNSNSSRFYEAEELMTTDPASDWYQELVQKLDAKIHAEKPSIPCLSKDAG